MQAAGGIGDKDKADAASLPPNCSSIIVWSCATMGLFRHSLFAALGRLAHGALQGFKPYEVTNMLWAFAQFIQQSNPSPAGLAADIARLVDAAVQCLRKRGFSEFKVVSLASALVSLDTLARCAVGGNVFKVGFDIADELLKRSSEWSSRCKEMNSAIEVMQSMGLDLAKGDKIRNPPCPMSIKTMQ